MIDQCPHCGTRGQRNSMGSFIPDYWVQMQEQQPELDRLRAEVSSLQGRLDARIEQLHESESYGFRLTQQLAAAKEYAERLREALGHTAAWIEGLPVPTTGATARLKQIDAALALPKPWEK